MGIYGVLDNRNIRNTFFARMAQAEAGTFAAKVAMMLDSDRAIEQYNWLGHAPVMREWIGSRQERQLNKFSYTITNRKFESTLAISNDDIRRDKTAQIMARVADLGARTAQHWDQLLSELLLLAEGSTAAGLCYDGQYFFDTDHSEGDSGTQTNDLTATEVPAANVTTATAPTSAELAGVLVQTVGHMYSFKDDQGQPINQNARNFLVMVPTTFWGAAAQAVSKELLAVGGATVTNPATGLGVNFEVVDNPRLTWTTKLALFRTDGIIKPLIMQSETGVETEIKDDSFDNDRQLFGVKANRAVGFGMWQHAALVTLS